MDGTLIDSEQYHWIAWQETMAAVGYPITHEQFLSTFGQRNDTILTGWLGASATPELIEELGKAKEERYRDLVRDKGISSLPGVEEWVHRLFQQGWLQAIASAAPRMNVDVILSALPLARCFQGSVSAEDVQRGKPDPEVYLTAAAKLGAPAMRCIVVEDARAGVEAARRAGMRSIGVGRNSAMLEADVVVGSLDGLPQDAFESLLRNPLP
jgi:beta-phosphoglucomutase